MIFKYIGKTTGGYACLLTSPIAFEALEGCDDISADYFNHKASGDGGSDELGRILEANELALTGKEIKLEKPLEFSGKRREFLHDYDWTIWVMAICETKSTVNKEGEIQATLELVKTLREEVNRTVQWGDMLDEIERRVKRAIGGSR